MPIRRPKLRWLFGALFALALGLTAVFGVRLVLGVIYWSQPDNLNQPIEGWMPLGFVARSWDVPREVMAEAVGLAPDTRTHQSLDQIARARGMTLEALIAQIEASISVWREQPHE